MKTKAWIGIDPGVTGSAALVTRDGDIQGILDWQGIDHAREILEQWVDLYSIEAGAIEKVNGFPRTDGGNRHIVSINKLMRNSGQWEGLLCALGIPYLRILPQKWQRGLVSKSLGPSPKKRSLAAARSIFKNQRRYFVREMDHNRADAALIALHATNYNRRKIELIRRLEGDH